MDSKDESQDEELVETLDIAFQDHMTHLCDQKEDVLELRASKSSRVSILLRIKWKHNADMLKLDKLKKIYRTLKIEIIKDKDIISKIEKILDRSRQHVIQSQNSMTMGT